MKKNIIITVLLSLVSIDYLIKGYTSAAIFTALLSVIPMIKSSKHIILDKSIAITTFSLIAFLSIIIYFSELYVMIDFIHVYSLTIALNSGLLINILNHSTEANFDSASEVFKVLATIFLVFLFISLVIPNSLIDNYFYLDGKLSLIALVLIIFGPYLFMNELAGVLRLIR